MSPPVTSSPIKPVNSSDMNDANIWCGGDNSKVTSNSKQIRNMRQTVEAELQNLALAGDTHKLIKLLEDGAPFVIDMDGQTVLHIAASAGHLETVEALLDRGCDANVQDFTGHTALQRASSGGHINIVRVLLSQGASLDHQDELHGNTALHEAAWKGFSQSVSMLCGSKANVYMKNRGGFTPLHLSCQNGHNQSCRVLLLHGCRPDVKNNYGDTPFHTAARYGHAGVIRILISAKCKVSEQNKNGDTALHIAAAMGRKKLTKILVEAGTDTNIRNKQNETALDIAVRKHLSDIVTILECNNIQNIISDLEPSAEESREVRQILNQSEERKPSYNQSEERRQSYKQPDERRQSYCQPEEKRPSEDRRRGVKDSSVRAKRPVQGAVNRYDSDLSSSLSSSNHSSNNIRAEHKYHKKTKQKHAHVHAPAVNDKGQCDCTPLLEKIGKTIEKDKKDILTHLVQNNKKIETRLDSFEKKTKSQMFNFNQNMKECFANERNDCQERMERRFLKDNIEMERQRAIRDIMIKRDIARWLQARLAEIEQRHGLGGDNAADNRAVLRKLTRRKSRREARAVITEMKHGGTLRRAHSMELVSDAESCHHQYRGLTITDKPLHHVSDQVSPSDSGANTSDNLVTRTRVRHNSEGNYDDVSIMQETILKEEEEQEEGERVYQNLMFHKDLTQFKNEARVRVPLPTNNDTDSSCSLTSLTLADNMTANQRPAFSGWTNHKLPTSDTGSLDSHNDSGYSTRLGISDPASPSLSSITDSEPLLDPQAIYMIPQSWNQTNHKINYNNNNINDVVINSKSSLV